MAEDRDQPSELPTSERVASVRSQLRQLRERLEELQRLAPQPPPPLPPAPPPVETTVGEAAHPAHDGGRIGAPPDEHHTMTTSVANSAAVHIASDATAMVAVPAAPAVTAAVTPPSWPRARRARNTFKLALDLAQRPGFCCCCFCLGPLDAKRARRIFALVRAIRRAQEAERRRRR